VAEIAHVGAVTPTHENRKIFQISKIKPSLTGFWGKCFKGFGHGQEYIYSKRFVEESIP